MSIIHAIEFMCQKCQKPVRTTEFSFDEKADGACGDPECCGYPNVWVEVTLKCPICKTDAREQVGQ